MWPVTNSKVITDIAAIMGPKPMFIADGHHRYETACNYKDFLCEKGPLDSERKRSEEHTSELQSRLHLVCRLLLEKKKKDSTSYSRLVSDYSRSYISAFRPHVTILNKAYILVTDKIRLFTRASSS